MRIGLVPMAAKPYHTGHHWLVEQAAADNDKVLLYVSLSDRKRKGEKPIRGADMKRIWEEELESILPSNVVPVYGGSPVKNVMDVLIDAEEKAQAGSLDSVYTVYSDSADTARNYSPRTIGKYFPTAYADGNVRLAAEENPTLFTRGAGAPDISGTAMRSALQTCNIEAFQAGLPDGVNAKKVYDILCGGMNEDLLRLYVKSILR